MSDRYRPPPAGPRSGRESIRGDKLFRGGGRGGKNNYKGTPRRPGERDNYRPGADSYKPNQRDDYNDYRDDHRDGYRDDHRDGYRDDYRDSYRDDSYREGSYREYSDRDYKQPKHTQRTDQRDFGRLNSSGNSTAILNLRDYKKESTLEKHDAPEQKDSTRERKEPAVSHTPLGPGKLPSGPSSYREESGTKRPLPPSEPSSLRKKRDFHTDGPAPPNPNQMPIQKANTDKIELNDKKRNFNDRNQSNYNDQYENNWKNKPRNDQRNQEWSQGSRNPNQRNQGQQRTDHEHDQDRYSDDWRSRNDKNGSYPTREQQRERSKKNKKLSKVNGAPSKAVAPKLNPPKGPKLKQFKEPEIHLKPSQIYSIRTIRPIEAYKIVQQVGEGTYGKVYKAKNSLTDEDVAMKRLRLESEKEGFPITALREIKLLQSFHHPNVVGLLEMMVDHNQIFMIFDYMAHDLTGLLTHPDLVLGECHRKFIFQQLLEGLNYLHHKRIIHRDIKGSNILLDNVGRPKIADFGLARPMKILKNGESPDYTNRVITIWYRPPELLLGATDYGREVDIWGVGCLLIELYTKIAVFQGFDEIGQLTKIFNVMGTPTLAEWPDISNLPWFEMMKPKINIMSNFRRFKSILTPTAYDLAEKLLCMNPANRLDAEHALQHAYFTELPRAEPLTFLKDVQGEWHEFETKKRRRTERKRLQDEAKGQAKEIESKGTSVDARSDEQKVEESIPPSSMISI